jgi:hypothetical protein
MVCSSRGLFDISATSSAQVGAQQFILPIFPPKPELESMLVIHANLIRRLFQIGISKQSILLLQNLYQNAKSYIKWNGVHIEGELNFL